MRGRTQHRLTERERRGNLHGPVIRMLDKQFVFVAGLHRSGTSLLFQCLRDHPQISGFENTGVPEDEGQHLQSVYQPAHKFGRPGTFGFNPDSYLTESSPLVTEENRERS